MIGMMLYASLALMVLTVLSNRYWRRQLFKARDSANKLKVKVDDLTREVAQVASNYGSLAHDTAETERRAKRAEQELAVTLQELESKKEAATDRFYIFDRLEPRPGRFWEIALRHQPEQADERYYYRTWQGVRRYIVVADTDREAQDRISARFSRKHGFVVVHVIPCRLANMSVNRIAELSTFRHPATRGNGEDKPTGGTPRRASTSAART